MSLSSRKIESSDITTYGVVSAPDILTGTATQNKQVFDKLIRDRVKVLYNSLIDDLLASTAAGEIGCGVVGTHPADDIQGALEYLYGTTTEGVAKAVLEALKSEGHAEGKQNGVDVTSESPYYHNNAKYYSDNTDANATTCSTAKTVCETAQPICSAAQTSCATDKLVAEGFAKGEQGGVPATEGQTYYHDNAKWYKEQADADKTSCDADASSCASDKTTADTYRLKSEGYAVGKQNGVDVTSESPYYHNNAKYYCDQLNPQNKEDKGYLTAENTHYAIVVDRTGTSTGTDGEITFVTEA